MTQRGRSDIDLSLAKFELEPHAELVRLQQAMWHLEAAADNLEQVGYEHAPRELREYIPDIRGDMERRIAER
jgi:hypothetical protein